MGCSIGCHRPACYQITTCVLQCICCWRAVHLPHNCTAVPLWCGIVHLYELLCSMVSNHTVSMLFTCTDILCVIGRGTEQPLLFPQLLQDGAIWEHPHFRHCQPGATFWMETDCFYHGRAEAVSRREFRLYRLTPTYIERHPISFCVIKSVHRLKQKWGRGCLPAE